MDPSPNPFALLDTQSSMPPPAPKNPLGGESEVGPRLSILNYAILPVGTTKSKRTNDTGKNEGQPDLRTMSEGDRKWLTQGSANVSIFNGNHWICNVPKALFVLASTKAGLLINAHDEIHLQADTNRSGVHRICLYIKEVANWKGDTPRRMAATTVHIDLVTHGAAVLLGLDMYTVHMHNWYIAGWKHDMASYEALDAICGLPPFLDPDQKAFRTVVQSLARHVRENSVPDKDVFTKYLATKAGLQTAIQEANTKHANWLRHQEREAQASKVSDQRLQQVAERRKKEAAEAGAKAQRDRQLEASIKEKMKTCGKKFTFEESRYWTRTRGKRPPTGR
ncbi:hypothetical protein P280DRAFT_538303 [Massarina eburnea CBS 473.64]|uniref:Uncharacterized protein n=1 Tax=Massarina eburnea CBS 473.64 TaxID=1395130 RepID=A0A6A6RGW4_9PLEO|nr:hypothetical protein P280DRAFT_538303 [Massarina eburnea CBS 473.64]